MSEVLVEGVLEAELLAVQALSAQQVGIDAVRQRQFRHRNAGLQTGFDQFALGLRVVAASAIPLGAND